MELEKRMYFFVPYQLTGIQQGIQCGHAALRYAKKYWENPVFIDFRDNWETWVILNGGSTNSRQHEIDVDPNCKPIGTLNQIHNQLVENKIDCVDFYEPDLQDAMTAICFICDERVFNKEKYEDFEDKLLDDQTPTKQWIKSIGGEKNLFLRELLKGKRLA